MLNNTPTSDDYTDAATTTFAGRPGFSVQVSNAGVFYRVGVVGPAGRGTVWESGEHATVPALLTFSDPTTEGFAPGSMYAGIMFRSSVKGTPAVVTVN